MSVNSNHTALNSRDVTRVNIARYIQNFFIPIIVSTFLSLAILVLYVSYSSNLTQENFLNIKSVLFNTSPTVNIREEMEMEEAKKLYVILKTFESQDQFAGEFISKKTLENGKIIANLKLKKEFAESYYYNKVKDSLTTLLLIFLFSLLITATISIKVFTSFSKKFAKDKLDNQHIRGSKLIENEEDYIKLQKERGIKNGAPIGHKGVVMDNKWLNYHNFIVGSTGAGKTILLNRDYVYYKKTNPNFKAIVHDIKSDWVKKFYNPETDFILNFFDRRSFDFNIFDMIKEIRDIFGIVDSIAPENPDSKDPTWDLTARGILTGLIFYCIVKNEKTNKAVSDLISLPRKQLVRKLKEALIIANKNLNGEAKNAVVNGISAALSTIEPDVQNSDSFLQSFQSRTKFFTMQPLQTSEKKLDLEKWINSKGQSTIFMLNDSKSKELNSIVIATFVDYFLRTILEMQDDSEFSAENGFKRRINLYIDEAGSLKKINSIVSSFTLLRAYGVHINFGIQDFAQIEKIYGKFDCEAIINSCGTKTILRSNSDGQDHAATAKKAADMLGKTQYFQTKESISAGTEIGANREGISLSRDKVTESVVESSDIIKLEPNQYYIQIGNTEWTKIKTKFIPEIDTYPIINKGFEIIEGLRIDNMTFIEDITEDEKMKKLMEDYEEEQFNSSLKGSGEEDSGEDSLKDIRGSDFI